MGRYYAKSMALIAFTLVSYLITRWISPGLSETEAIARRLQIQKVQGNIIIQGPEQNDALTTHKLLKVKVPQSEVKRRRKSTELHPGKEEAIMNITCENSQKAEHFEKKMEKEMASKRIRKRLPTVLVIGAKKSGTGALMQFLGTHPNVTSDWGEGHYFDDDKLYNKGLKNYWHMMPTSLPTQITIEKTPYYFVDPKVPPRVKCFNPNIKLILILKDPVQRLLSDYVHERFHGIKMKKNLTENLHSFEELVINKKTGEVNSDYKPVAVGDYHLYLERWMKYFPKNQFLILDGEVFLKNPVRVLKEVEQFLNIPTYFTSKSLVFDKQRGYFCLTKSPRKGGKCMDPDKGRKQTYPKVKKEVLTKLEYYYRPHNEKLFQDIGQPFPWK